MKPSAKPVRKCHACKLNQGDRCWAYACPRDQWRGERRCAGLENELLYRQFDEWQREPDVKTRKELRREAFRSRPKRVIRRMTSRRGSSKRAGRRR